MRRVGRHGRRMQVLEGGDADVVQQRELLHLAAGRRIRRDDRHAMHRGRGSQGIRGIALHLGAVLGRADDRGAGDRGDVPGGIRMVEMAMANEDEFGLERDQLGKRCRDAIRIVLARIDVGIEQHDAAAKCRREARDAEPREDDLVGIHEPGDRIHVLGPEEMLARFHDRELSTNSRSPTPRHYCDPNAGLLGAGERFPFLGQTWG